MTTKKAADEANTAATEQAPEAVEVTEVETSHPSIDVDPRAGTTAEQNRVDWNDPTRSGQEVVEAQLAANSTND